MIDFKGVLDWPMFKWRPTFTHPRVVGIELTNFIKEHTGRMSLKDWGRWGEIKYRYEREQRLRAHDGFIHQTFAEWMIEECKAK